MSTGFGGGTETKSLSKGGKIRAVAHMYSGCDGARTPEQMYAENPTGTKGENHPSRPASREQRNRSCRRAGSESQGAREERARQQAMAMGQTPGPGAGRGGRHNLSRSRRR